MGQAKEKEGWVSVKGKEKSRNWGSQDNFISEYVRICSLLLPPLPRRPAAHHPCPGLPAWTPTSGGWQREKRKDKRKRKKKKEPKILPGGQEKKILRNYKSISLKI